MAKLLTNKNFILNATLLVVGVVKWTLESKSDAMVRTAMKNELKKEILKELGKDVVEVVTEEVTN